jgi:hypothetical protein
MDRLTKATLWVASIILISYVVWFYADCALDDACRIVCVKSGRGKGRYFGRAGEV